jgi:hypothetical protein
MRVMKFRTLLDTEDDVFRDIEIPEDSTLKELHEQLLHAFGLSGQEMASFYRSDDQWNKGEEFPLIDMGDEEEGQRSMDQVSVVELIDENEGELKLLYVYNFLNMWVFCLDLVKRFEAEEGVDYPRVAMAIGEAPEESADDLDPLKGLDLGEEGEESDEESTSNGKSDGDVGSDVEDLFKDL